jgi:hypothetical protein
VEDLKSGKLFINPIKSKQMAKRENFVSLTDQDVQRLKAMIRTGEPIAAIADRMAPVYKRPVNSFYVTLHNLAKRTYKIAEWTGPKRRRKNAKTVAPTQQVSNRKSIKVEKFDDHIRIYF